MKKATLVRQDKQTFGVLTCGNQSWFSVEREWADNKSGISCIPVGTYSCKWTLSPRLKKYTYEVLNVPGRAGIRIHSANFPHQLLGCISVGKKVGLMDGKRGVFLSAQAIREFNTLLNGEDFLLEVK